MSKPVSESPTAAMSATSRIVPHAVLGQTRDGFARRRREAGTAAAAARTQRETEELLLKEVLDAVGVPDCFGLTCCVLAQVERCAAHRNDRAVGRGNVGLVDSGQLVEAVVAVVAGRGGDHRSGVIERGLERRVRRRSRNRRTSSTPRSRAARPPRSPRRRCRRSTGSSPRPEGSCSPGTPSARLRRPVSPRATSRPCRPPATRYRRSDRQLGDTNRARTRPAHTARRTLSRSAADVRGVVGHHDGNRLAATPRRGESVGGPEIARSEPPRRADRSQTPCARRRDEAPHSRAAGPYELLDKTRNNPAFAGVLQTRFPNAWFAVAGFAVPATLAVETRAANDTAARGRVPAPGNSPMLNTSSATNAAAHRALRPFNPRRGVGPATAPTLSPSLASAGSHRASRSTPIEQPNLVNVPPSRGRSLTERSGRTL